MNIDEDINITKTSESIPIILKDWETFVIGLGIILFLFIIFFVVNKVSSPRQQFEDFDE